MTTIPSDVAARRVACDALDVRACELELAALAASEAKAKASAEGNDEEAARLAQKATNIANRLRATEALSTSVNLVAGIDPTALRLALAQAGLLNRAEAA